MLRDSRSTERPRCPSRAPALTGAGAAVFRALAEADGNVAVSPASLEIALAMAAAGATPDSRTFQELSAVLGLDEIGDEAVVHASMKKTLAQLLGGSPRKRIIVANSIWAAGGIKQEFADRCKDVFCADAFPLQGAGVINAWIDANTHGHIKQLLSRDPDDTVLINVLFFEAAWLTSFDHAKTSDADFNSFHGRVACRMMSNPALNCRVGRTARASFAVLPYAAPEDADADADADAELGAFCALVVLPDSDGRTALRDATADLFTLANSVDAAVSGAERARVRFSMPVFDIDSQVLSLKDTLQRLHVRELFDPLTADLKRMSANHTWASDVIQRVVIKVNEKGTVAAAASAVSTTRGGGGPPHFLVNRPFLFVVFDTRTRITLFAAKVETV
jgi:serpin B